MKDGNETHNLRQFYIDTVRARALIKGAILQLFALLRGSSSDFMNRPEGFALKFII